MTYVCHILTLLCLTNCDIHLCSSHCDDKAMFITLWRLHMFVALWHDYVSDDRVVIVTVQWEVYVHHIMTPMYVPHITMTRLCSPHCDIHIGLSHCDVTIVVMLWNPCMLVTLRGKRCVNQIVTYGYVCHIATWLCLWW